MSNQQNNKWRAIAGTVGAVATLFIAQSAFAIVQVSAPTLHGVCVSPTAPCIDNGTNTPTSDPNPHFTFTGSPGGATGDLRIEVLIPTSAGILASFGVSGTQGGSANNQAISATASLFSSTAWTSGQLDAYLGLSPAASPANPIGAFIGGSFYVYQADLGSTTIWANGSPGSGPQMTLGAPLPTGAYVLAFLGVPAPTGAVGAWGATANSGAIYETGHQTVPEPATLGLLGLGLAAAGMARRKRQH